MSPGLLGSLLFHWYQNHYIALTFRAFYKWSKIISMKVLKSLFSMVAFLASQGGNTVGPPVLEREQFMLEQTD